MTTRRSLSHRTLAAAVLLGPLALAVPRVGEPDRSELRVISSIRAIVSAESAFASANGGRYGMLDCLAEPGSCTPGPVGRAPFLSQSLATARDRDESHFKFYAHPDPGSEERQSAVISFAVIAVPVSAGARPAAAATVLMTEPSSMSRIPREHRESNVVTASTRAICLTEPSLARERTNTRDVVLARTPFPQGVDSARALWREAQLSAGRSIWSMTSTCVHARR